MASLARSAFGTLLKIGDGGGTEAFTTISELTSVSVDGPTVETIDVTNHDSPSAYREYIASLIEGGTCSFEGNWISSTTQDQVRTDMVARTRRNFQIVYPLSSPETHSFAGIITTFSVGDATVDGKLTCSGSIQITSAITVS
jgi:predicted secreted protein